MIIRHLLILLQSSHFSTDMGLATVVAAALFYLLNMVWGAVVWFFSKSKPDTLMCIRYNTQLLMEHQTPIPNQLRGSGFMLTVDDLLPRPSPTMRCWTYIWGLVRGGASRTAVLVGALVQWFEDRIWKLLLGSSS